MKIIKGHKAILAGLAFVVGMLFSGCGSSMPKCDDKEVLDLITQLEQNRLLQAGMCSERNNKFDDSLYYKKLHKLGYKSGRAYCEARKYDYSAFMINSVDKEIKKISCKAQVSLKKSPSIEVSYEGEVLQIALTSGFGLAFLGLDTGYSRQAGLALVGGEYFIKYTAQATQDGQVYVEVLGYE